MIKVNIIIINIHSDIWPCLYSSKAKPSVRMHVGCSLIFAPCSAATLVSKITHSVIHVCCSSKGKKKSNLLGCGIQHNVFTCANSNVLVTPRKHTHCVFINNQKQIKSTMGDLEGTGNVSVGLQQSHELLFSSHLPHQLDAHDQQHPPEHSTTKLDGHG